MKRCKSIRAACHVQSDVLCYIWNHAERPLNIDARPFLSFNIRKNIFSRVSKLWLNKPTLVCLIFLPT